MKRMKSFLALMVALPLAANCVFALAEETKLGHIGILFAAVWLMRHSICGRKNEKPLLYNGEPDGECGDGI